MKSQKRANFDPGRQKEREIEGKREGDEHLTLSTGQYTASKGILAKEGNRCAITKASVPYII